MAASYLRGDAEAWWFKDVTKRRRFHYPQISSWEDMKQHLRRKYVPSHVPEHIMRYSTRPLSSQAPSQQRVTKQVEPLTSPTAQVPSHFSQPLLTHPMTSLNHLSRPEVSTTGPEDIPSAARKTFTKDHPKADAVQQPNTDNITVQKATVDTKVAAVLIHEDDTKESLAHTTNGDNANQPIHGVPTKEDSSETPTLSKQNPCHEPGTCLHPCDKAVVPMHINDAGKQGLALKLLERERQNVEQTPDSPDGEILQGKADMIENMTSVLRAPRNELDHKFNPEPYNKWKPKDPHDSVQNFPTPKINVSLNHLIFYDPKTVIMHFFLPLSVRAGTGNKAWALPTPHFTLDQHHHEGLYKEILIKSPTKEVQRVPEAKKVKEKPPDPSTMEDKKVKAKPPDPSTREVGHFTPDKKVKEKPPDPSTMEDKKIKEKPPDPPPQHQQPHHMLAQGKFQVSNTFNITDLASFDAGTTVLRTKPPQEGGNDEDIQPEPDQEEEEPNQGGLQVPFVPNKPLTRAAARSLHRKFNGAIMRIMEQLEQLERAGETVDQTLNPPALKEDSKTHLSPGDEDQLATILGQLTIGQDRADYNHTRAHLKPKEATIHGGLGPTPLRQVTLSCLTTNDPG